MTREQIYTLIEAIEKLSQANGTQDAAAALCLVREAQDLITTVADQLKIEALLTEFKKSDPPTPA